MQVDQPEVAKPSSKRDDRKKPRGNGDRPKKPTDQKINNPDTAAQDSKPKKDKEPRKPRFTPPVDWKEQAQKSVTIDSKIPALPADVERLHKPNYNKLKADLEFCEMEMDKHYKKIDALKDEQKKIRFELKDKNSTLYDELKRLNEEKKTYAAGLTENKELKNQYKEKISHIEDQLRSVEKKSFSGKLMTKDEINEQLRVKEQQFQNMKKTATEEKKMNDEITKLRNMLKTVPEFDKLQKELKKYNEMIREINKNNKEVFDKLQKVSDLIGEIKVRLDETNLKIKQEKAEEKEGEKKKYVPSVAEQQLDAMRQEHFDEIKKMKERKQKLREAYERDWYEFEKQQFELDRIHFMQKIQKTLKRDERERRRKEEEEKQRVYEEEKAKELLQFKYQEEINLCESLVSLLEDLKPDKKVDSKLVESKELTQHNVNQDLLKQENLVYIKPKKFDEAAEPVVNKKKNKQQKNNKKKEVPVVNSETEKVNIHFDTLHLFNELKVVPPATFGQLDSVISQLNEKKSYYLQLREKEMEEASKVKETGDDNTNEEVVEAKENGEESQKKEDKPVRQQKAVELKDDDFPEL